LKHQHVNTIFGCKKLPSQTRSPKWRFFEDIRVLWSTYQI